MSTPVVPIFPATKTVITENVKIATSNLFVFDETSVPQDAMVDLIFEDIGGQEIIDIATADSTYSLNTTQDSTQLIKNLSSLSQKYNPQNILALQGTSSQYKNNFAIDIDAYTPYVGNGPNGSHIYIDQANGSMTLDSLIIDLININFDNNERVEVEIIAYDSLQNDTIYT